MTSERAPGMSIIDKNGIIKGDGSLDALFPRLWEKFKVFWNPEKSGYPMQPIGVKDDL